MEKLVYTPDDFEFSAGYGGEIFLNCPFRKSCTATDSEPELKYPFTLSRLREQAVKHLTDFHS